MNKNIIVAVIAIVAIVAGIAVFSANKNEQSNTVMESKTNEQMMEKKQTPEQQKMEENKMPASGMENESMMKEEGMMAKEKTYKDYSAQTVAEEQKKGQKVVLFFYASWCPYCKAADGAFKANLDKIPAGVSVLKTNYDTEKELKTKYGVTYQHTFVQIDTSGNIVTKWNSGDVDLLVKNVK